MAKLVEQVLTRKLATGMRIKQLAGQVLYRGFTLIEILVVLVIIGITLGFALITFGDFGEGRRLLFSAEQVANTLKLAQQQAILEGSTLGLYIDNTGYQVLKYKDSSHWKPMFNKKIFGIHSLPKNTLVSLSTKHPSLQKTPSIIISPSGDMSSFMLYFGTAQETKIILLKSSANGNLHCSPVKIK
jgi:general secretion pathway protein H